MKFLVVLVCSVMMTGCFYQSVNISDLNKAASYCNGLDNIMKIDAWSTGYERIFCMDGSSKRTSEIKLPKL
ncbi:hypothetical protein VP501E541_P0104 [Vibrio phage 501E54-1]|nr:hypothetical protein VP501E541_P0104 [Vibrio phage 501E54-1]